MLNFRRKAKKIKGRILRLFRKPYKKSYSQTGEDILVQSLFKSINIDKPSYIDIGANSPFYINNTALFYKHGSSGINIEPNPRLYSILKNTRKRDINLNVGIGKEHTSMSFYIMSSDTMSTFSKAEAKKLSEEYGFSIESVIEVPVMTIYEIINKYNNGFFPDFLSIDTEGMDYEILECIDYSHNYPKVICAETREYGEGMEVGKRDGKIEKLLTSKGYRVYANTYLNTIFYKK